MLSSNRFMRTEHGTRKTESDIKLQQILQIKYVNKQLSIEQQWRRLIYAEINDTITTVSAAVWSAKLPLINNNNSNNKRLQSVACASVPSSSY